MAKLVYAQLNANYHQFVIPSIKRYDDFPLRTSLPVYHTT